MTVINKINQSYIFGKLVLESKITRYLSPLILLAAAQSSHAATLSSLINTASDDVGSTKKSIFNILFVVGLVIFAGGVFAAYKKTQRHADIKMGQIAGAMVIGIILMALRFFITTTGNSVGMQVDDSNF